MHAKTAWAPCRAPARLRHSGPLEQRCSLTLATTLNYVPSSTEHVPLVFTYREGSNTALDFADFIVTLLEHQVVSLGCILVMDNAAVHNDNEDTAAAFDRLETAGVLIRRLPTYSPELNPCELVFAFVKNHLRTVSDRIMGPAGYLVDRPFKERLSDALGLVTQELVHKYYNKCRRAESSRR